MKYINSHVIFYTAVLVFAFLSSGTLKITQGIPIKDPGTLNLKTEVVSNRVNDPFVQPLFGPTEAYGDGTTKKSHEVKRYPVASFDFDHVAAPFVITAWIFAACCAKIVFHVSPKLVNYCPESCMLLLVGVALGLVLFHSGMIVGPLTPTVFFLFMLPPIVFDAGYFMPNRLFFDNIISILVYAVIGTVWNALTIGASLWAIGLTGIFGYEISLIEMLLFSSIISAVDPVAVLAVFEEIHVNEVLYIIVFGESLLNDAVTVVLYHMFEGYTEMGIPNILPIDYFSGVASFFVVSLGGTFIGIFFGVMTAFLSKFTTPVAVIEPMFPFIMGYLSYLFAEMFHLSGILSLIFCGITMKNYVVENISNKSHVTVKYVTKMLATASETIIFVVLGVSTVNDSHEWNTWFVLFSILFCSVYRAIGVVVLSWFLNKFRLHQLNAVEQFIMSYGGLRGAVAFALVLIIDKNLIPSKDMMVTTTIAVVYFTVFVQGMTIKFFVRILKVPQQSDKTLTMNERLHSTLIDHVMGGIEEVADQFLGNYKIRDRFKYFNNKYLRRFLTNNSQIQEPKIFETHSKLNLIDAMKMVNSGSKLTLDPGASISTLLKSYTSANLSQQPKDEENGVVNQSPLMNLDIGELSYNPSFKDLNDSQIHHILDDAMFKPSNRRARRYSHSQFYDNEPKHPPFHHKMRWQIRELVSETRRRKRKNKYQTGDNHPSNGTDGHPISRIFLRSSPNHPEVTVTSPGDYDNDEGGITFSVASTTPIEELEEPVERTLTETILPWKRGNDVNNTYPAKPQEEFPTWVENRDHYPGYMSPTLTYLESIQDSQPSSSKFNTYCIDEEEFGSEDEVFGDHQENENRVEPEESQPGCSKAFEERSLDEIEEDIIKEVMEGAQKRNAKTFQEKEIMKEAQKRKADTTHEERRRFFRNSATRSPDRISMMSINSEDFARPLSDLSIECPDVVVDLEDKDGCKNTKL